MRTMTIDDYLRMMQATFSADRTQGKYAVLQYRFSGAQEGVCHAVVEHGTIRVCRGEHPAPTAEVRCDFQFWMRILAYQEEPLLAYQDGKYAVAGDLETLMDSDAWFVRP